MKYDGYQIAPGINSNKPLMKAELEMILNTHPGISEGSVVGVPQPNRPENDIPVAFVVSLDKNLREKDVTDFVNGQVSHFKQIRRVTFMGALLKVVALLRWH